jgi:hypothetical protein
MHTSNHLAKHHTSSLAVSPTMAFLALVVLGLSDLLHLRPSKRPSDQPIISASPPPDPLPPGQPTTFPKFPLLPPEIRQQIFALALPDRRIVELRLQPASKASYHEYTRVWRSPCPPPALLHVSREARSIALKRYRLAFRGVKWPAAIYVDFATDIFCFGKGTWVERKSVLDSCMFDFENIRFLAVGMVSECLAEIVRCKLSVLCGLREVIAIKTDGLETRDELVLGPSPVLSMDKGWEGAEEGFYVYLKIRIVEDQLQDRWIEAALKETPPCVRAGEVGVVKWKRGRVWDLLRRRRRRGRRGIELLTL